MRLNISDGCFRTVKFNKKKFPSNFLANHLKNIIPSTITRHHNLLTFVCRFSNEFDCKRCLLSKIEE